MTPAHKFLTRIAEKIVLPSVYHNIKVLVLSPDACIDDFVEVINHDPALAVRIIKVANSQFFGYARKVKTVKQAISIIGVMQLHDLLLSSLAIRAFSGIPEGVINQQVFWRSCIFCGIVARLLARKCMLPASERLFTLGLLHEIGHIVMYAKIPEKMQDALFESQKSSTPLYLLEREKIGFDYGQVGCEIMRLWHLPETYGDIAKYHMEPEKAQKNIIEVQLVNIARSIMLAKEDKSGVVIGSIISKQDTLISKNLTIQDIDAIKNNARLYVDDVINCLWPFSRNVAADYEILL